MKIKLIALFLGLFALFELNLAANNEITTWEQFKAVYNKEYSSPEEELLRKDYFLENLKWIQENQNKNGLTFGINSFADLSHEEFDSQYNLQLDYSKLMEGSPKPQHEISSYATLPIGWDWRSHFLNNKIEHQGGCGACWAFASAFTMEAQYAIRKQKSITLSKQELMDCTMSSYDSEYKNEGCRFGYASDTFKYAIKHGVHAAAYYPFLGHNGTCSYTKIPQNSELYHISEYHQMAYNVSDTNLMDVIMNVGPVTALVYVDPQDRTFKYLRGNAIMRNLFPNDKRVNHMISIIGWGHNDGVDYWIIRNSWGTEWGDQGYGYLERGHNLLGINYFIFYPVLH